MSRSSRPKTKSHIRTTLDCYEDRITPVAGFSSVPANAVVIAPDDGGIPLVRVVDPTTGKGVASITAYEDAFRGGVHAALGDVTGDGVRDIVLSPGKGGGPRVRIIDGKSGDTVSDFFVYEPSFTGGVYVSAGDVNGDGMDDIITGTGVGGGPRVRVLDGKTLGATVLKDYFAYEDSFRGGVQVSSGDVNGDGLDDVIAGTGVGGGPRVQVFDGRDDRVLRNFFAYEDSFRGGVQVSSGDVNGDGLDDVLVGSGVGGGPVVRVLSGADGKELANMLTDDPSFRGGVRVDSVDTNGDGFDDLVSRTRRGNDDTVRVFDGRSGTFSRSVTRTVDDNPSANDRIERPAGGGTVTTGVPSRVEGIITAVDATARTVQLRLQSGTLVTVTAGPNTEVERNDGHTTLATFVVGEKGEALIGPDGIAWKIESGSNDGGSSDDSNDDSGSDNGGSSDDTGNSGSDGGSGSGSGGGSGNGSGSRDDNSGSGGDNSSETRVEGTVTAIDATAGTVSIQRQSGATVTVRTGPQTKIERNDAHTTLAAFKVGDRGEARIGADGIATKVEAIGA